MESGEGNLPQELETKKPLLYHHSRPLEFVEYGTVTQKLGINEDYDSSYRWLEKEVGFAPLFLAVGSKPEDRYMTGYQDQWRKILSGSKGSRTYRKKGEYPNLVLFSYSDVPNGIFTDFDNWHLVLNSSHNNHQLSEREKKLIFRSSWKKSDWLRYNEKESGSVQLVVPELDLIKAEAIWVRNKNTQKKLQQMGFANVEVKRTQI